MLDVKFDSVVEWSLSREKRRRIGKNERNATTTKSMKMKSIMCLAKHLNSTRPLFCSFSLLFSHNETPFCRNRPIVYAKSILIRRKGLCGIGVAKPLGGETSTDWWRTPFYSLSYYGHLQTQTHEPSGVHNVCICKDRKCNRNDLIVQLNSWN